MPTILTARCFPNVRTGVGLYSAAGGEAEAMLGEGHWIPKHMPLLTIYPRPDSETQSFDRHRNFHSSFRYEIPIGVQGGAWPFQYKLLVAPLGATIGEQIGDSNYGVISWTPSGQTGSQRFTVLVTDQDGDSTTITWTTTLNNAGFVFIKSDVVSSGTGTFESPLKTFNDWYKGNVNDATFHNKIAVFVGGTYNVIGDTATDGNVKFNLAAKTNSIIGDPDSRPTFDCATAKFYNSVKVDGLYISHINFTNARNDIPNAHFFWVTLNPDRITFFKNDFTGILHGTVGNDNTGPIFISDGDGVGVLIKGNTYHDFSNNGGGNGTYCTIYKYQNVLVEDESAWNCSTGLGWFLKGTFATATIRNITAVDNVQGTQAGIGYGAECGRPPATHEACYLNIHVSNNVVSFMAANSDYYSSTGIQPIKSLPIAVYRNTFTGGSAWIRYPGSADHEVDANIVVTNTTARWELDSMVTVVPNVVSTTATNLVDLTTGNLTGAGLAYKGLKGHEVE
jgi:hypothetical protein